MLGSLPLKSGQLIDEGSRDMRILQETTNTKYYVLKCIKEQQATLN